MADENQGAINGLFDLMARMVAGDIVLEGLVDAFGQLPALKGLRVVDEYVQRQVNQAIADLEADLPVPQSHLDAITAGANSALTKIAQIRSRLFPPKIEETGVPITAKATIFFEDHKYGWSESYYQTGIDSLATIYEDTLALVELRAALNGEGVLMPYIRVSNEAIKRDSLVQQINLFTTTGQTGKPPVPAGATQVKPAMEGFPDRPYSAVHLRFEATSLYHSSHYMRGIPDDLIVDPVGPANNAAWAASYLLWVKQFTRANSRWKLKVLSKVDVNAFKPITTIGEVTGALTEVTVPAHGYVDGDPVHIENVREFPSVNGRWRIQQVLPNSFKIDLTGLRTRIVKPAKATAHRLEFVYEKVTDIVVRGQTHRDTGRPFDSPVGRKTRVA